MESIAGIVVHPDARATLIATHPAVRLRILSALVLLGVPLFAENPAGTRSAEVGDLAARAESSGLSARVGFMKRLAPAYRRVRQIARSRGTIGLQGRRTVGEYTADEEFLTDVAVHAFDLLRYLLGDVKLLAVDRVELAEQLLTRGGLWDGTWRRRRRSRCRTTSFGRLRDLLNLRLDLAWCDVTGTYVEGDRCTR
ncbi:Gfo/Idh/MocA family oxidoreductase [Limnochorda pilosa]|uniref:hypothetical protein n=1 Tax=Limnochorda pilosa TaxID=1555112 RepID=UPI00118768F4|nr:hypothetical protein [Limnochorda pilosa]